MIRRLGQAQRKPNTIPARLRGIGVGSSLTLDSTCARRRVSAYVVAAICMTCFAPHVAVAQAPEIPKDVTTPQLDKRAAEKQRRARPGNLIGHGGPIKALAVDAGTGRALTGSFDYAMMVWDVGAEVPVRLHRLDDHNGAVNAVAFVPGGKLALAAGDDGAVAVWD